MTGHVPHLTGPTTETAGVATSAAETVPPTAGRYLLTDPQHVLLAAEALARGGIIAQGFANFYVITTRPDAATVRRVNLMKGRPPDQVGSIITAPAAIPRVYDWSRLPAGLTRAHVRDLIDALYGYGPFGIRGPAAPHIPAHLRQDDGGIPTAQVIAPGTGCPSNEFLHRCLEAIGEDILYITSANRSRHLTGAGDEPAHWRAAGLLAEFGNEPGFMVLEHADEDAARRAYPRFAPMSTTIVAFHKTAGTDEQGRPRLIVERHGSLHVDHLRPLLDELGFGMALAPSAARRLELRTYDTGRLEGART
jgi:hypothetical protein